MTASPVDPAVVPGPLAGILVADFSRILAGPYCTMLLGDLGADVIKVEGPAGDDTRGWVPPAREGIATYYLSVNRNKRSIALDLDNDRDLAAAHELAVRADVLIENFKPGGLRRFNLDYESLRAGNPRLIYASISGFGPGGGAHLPGYDLIVQAMSGLMSLTGDPDGPGYRAGVSVFDVVAGLHAAIGILVALYHRRESGRGQHVELSLLASALSGLVNQASAFVAGGVDPFRMGNSHPSIYPYEPLSTADGDLVITAGNDRQFRKLCEVLGVAGLADDPRFARNGDRTVNRAALDPLLRARLQTRTRMEWCRELTAAGVPCGPINTIAGGVTLAEELGLAPIVVVGDGDGAVPSIRNPITLSDTPAGYRLPPPRLDEHSAEIRAWLGEPPAPRRPPPRRSIRMPRTEQEGSTMADETTTHAPGTPIWVDLSSSDVDAGRRFYQDLFGWTSDEPAPPEYGGYSMFKQGDKIVAGSGPLMEGGHPAWNTYVLSTDAAASAQKVRDAGGQVVMEPMQVMDSGSMAVFRDPTGAYISVWQAGTHAGAELFNEPVSLSWNELATRDVEAAKRFYSAVFGWTTKGDEYIEWQVGGKSIGGGLDMNAMGVPEQVPPHWLVYFAVKSCDETAARAKELGGSITMPARDIPGMGRFAVLADPQGAVFAAFSS